MSIISQNDPNKCITLDLANAAGINYDRETAVLTVILQNGNSYTQRNINADTASKAAKYFQSRVVPIMEKTMLIKHIDGSGDDVSYILRFDRLLGVTKHDRKMNKSEQFDGNITGYFIDFSTAGESNVARKRFEFSHDRNCTYDRIMLAWQRYLEKN